MSYTINRLHGCITVSGLIPLSDICALVVVWGKLSPIINTASRDDEWHMDGLLADQLGVNLVCGTRRDTRAWREKIETQRRMEIGYA